MRPSNIWNTRLLQTPIEEFFRTTTGILVLEGKTGKEIPQSLSLEFYVTFLANNFALLDPEDNISGSINSRFVFVEKTSGGMGATLLPVPSYNFFENPHGTPLPPLKDEAPHLKNNLPPLERESPFHDMISRKSTVNNNLKSS